MGDETPERDDWKPLSRRTAPDLYDDWDVLFEGIPEHVEATVGDWLNAVYSDTYGLSESLAHRLRDGRLHGGRSAVLSVWTVAEEEERLDLLDCTLFLLGRRYAETKKDPFFPTETTKTLARFLRRLVEVLL